MLQKFVVKRSFLISPTEPVACDVLHRFSHGEIDSNSFLREWTQVAWKDFSAFEKEHNCTTLLPPMFSEKFIPGLEHIFVSPLTIVLSIEDSVGILRYWVEDDEEN